MSCMSDVAEVTLFSDFAAEQKWEAPAAQDEDDEAAILAAMATVKQRDAALEAQLSPTAGREAYDSSSDDEVQELIALAETPERQSAESGHCHLSPSVTGAMNSDTCQPEAAAALDCCESHVSHPIPLLQRADPGVLSFIPPGAVMHPKPRSKRKADRSASLGSTVEAGAPGNSGAPRSQPKSGELVHVPATIPAEQQQQLFGRPVDHSSFQGLGLAKPLADHLEELNFSTPTLIQRAAVPPLLVRAPAEKGGRCAHCQPVGMRVTCARLSTARFTPAASALF